MEQLDLLRHMTEILEHLMLRYFVTGSTVTTYYGEPRFTNDIDIVVDLKEDDVESFCREFPQGEFRLSENAVRDAVRRKGQFNIIHPESGLKVDVIVPEPSLFNHSRFARARRVPTGPDFQASFASVEDVIIKKMDYYREGGSEKHLRDIAGVLKNNKGGIDENYILQWAERMGLGEIWKTIQRTI